MQLFGAKIGKSAETAMRDTGCGIRDPGFCILLVSRIAHPVSLTPMRKQKRLIVIVGPTAVGKTALAIRIASHYRTDIVSADSRQIFKELTIGTAKPNEVELAAVPHHFISSRSISNDYDAAIYGREALEVIHQLFLRHDDVVMCGGSGLYIKAVCEGFDDIPEVPDEVRDELIREYEANGVGWLQERMKQLDPEHFEVIDQQNPHRLIRALEVKIATGLSIATFRTKDKLKHNFSIVKIGLELPREELYERIDKRMDIMIEEGLFEEAEALHSFKNKNALQTVGYQEIFDEMDGLREREETIRLLKRNSRRYAKRQLTWFKRDPDIQWFSPNDVNKIMESLNR
jgi:tRNA dimethylallyltransferase